MPCFRELGLVLSSDFCDALQFRLAKAIVVRHSDRCEPELRELAIALHMNVDWLASIAREEEKSVGAAFQNSRTHRDRTSAGVFARCDAEVISARNRVPSRFSCGLAA